LVESLVCGDGHLDLISDSKQQKASLWLTQSYLSDDLVEALGEKFFSNWADAALACLTLHQLLIEHLAETSHVDTGCLLMGDVLDVVLACRK
jgi:hypothetical protein